MKSDASFRLYQKYMHLQNKSITLTLKNGRVLKGTFGAYMRGNIEWGEPYVLRWLFVEEPLKPDLGFDSFGYAIGELINQKDIASIKFWEDQSEMSFLSPA